jgi:hypothetical protein
MTHRAYEEAWDAHYVRAVRAAAESAFRSCAHRDVSEVYLALAGELTRRGIEPDPEAVYDGALLISRGKKPAVLSGSYA